ncbi:DUF4267 domain-containing protein [Mycolicibacterium goodii]|uniref:DUF4267 domain-containing protein n=1 Tax=Mycolicibacterium goodii TaxID=134601 RepID=UPI000A41D005
MSVDRAALAAGTIRFASGLPFLVDPLRANRLWGCAQRPDPTARLLLRSMGYRHAFIGALLVVAGLRGRGRRRHRGRAVGRHPAGERPRERAWDRRGQRASSMTSRR